MVQTSLSWPLPKEPYCEFCQLQDVEDLAILTDNLSFLEDKKEMKQTRKNILDDSTSSDDPEDFFNEFSWILNP